MVRRSAGFGLFLTFLTLLALVSASIVSPADARSRHRHAKPTPKDAAIVVDGTTGNVIYSRNANAQRYPASLTKMMTLYLLFEELYKGRITLDSMITISPRAVAQAPTKLGVSAGESISVELAIKALVVRSANDVAVAVAERLAGTESEFAWAMTRKARDLGMTHTVFRNASGLPNANQSTTARDLSILGRRLAYDFPQHYHYFATPSFNYQGRTFATHDNLLYRFAGTDGIKTGYTNASGFNLVSSVVREGKHIIAVVMGGKSARGRDNEMIQLLASTLARARHSPTLVAQARVPWQNSDATKSLTMLASNEPEITKSLNLRLNGFDDATAVLPESLDEDAAETMTAAGDATFNTAVVSNAAHANAATPAPELAALAVPVRSDPPPSARKAERVMAFTPPVPKPKSKQAKKAKLERKVAKIVPSRKPRLVIASLVPLPTPADAEKASATTPAGKGALPKQVTPRPADAAGARWAVQIGAFEDLTAAQAKLAAYAKRSTDLLRKAKRSVIAFQLADGRIFYRARFGPFGEDQARDVCRKMTERGQTCFAATVD